MASKDFLIRLSVVFKKFGLIANEFLSAICQFLKVGIINFSLDFYISYFGNKAINGFCNSVRFISSFPWLPAKNQLPFQYLILPKPKYCQHPCRLEAVGQTYPKSYPFRYSCQSCSRKNRNPYLRFYFYLLA